MDNPQEISDPQQIIAKANRVFGPVMAGMIIDIVDLATFGPIGLILGIPIGGAAGYWMGRCLKLSPLTSLYLAYAAAIYCTIPFTELLPLGTIAGAYVRFLENDNPGSDQKNKPA